MPKKTLTLEDLFYNKIKVLYDIETQLIKSFPTLIKVAFDSELVDGFSGHLEETKMHAKRLEHIFKLLGKKPQKLKSEAIRGLVADVAWVITHVQGAEALDANLIAAVSYIEHYEIAGYLAAAEWANMLELDDIGSLLIESLDEEVAADEKLFNLGSAKIFQRAISYD
jgi:ferritin-like metal-binding protein YciE